MSRPLSADSGRLLAAIGDGEARTGELAAKLGWSTGRVSTYAGRLAASGHVRKLGRGVWERVPVKDQAALLGVSERTIKDDRRGKVVPDPTEPERKPEPPRGKVAPDPTASEPAPTTKPVPVCQHCGKAHEPRPLLRRGRMPGRNQR